MSFVVLARQAIRVAPIYKAGLGITNSVTLNELTFISPMGISALKDVKQLST